MEDRVTALFKLISGEEVIAEYKTDNEFYILKQPRKVFLAQQGSSFGVKLMPWVIGNPDGVFPIHSSHVITCSPDASKELVQGYLGETSSIDLSATAPKSIIT